MSFFGRAANLIKGGIRSIGRSEDGDRDREARERALEIELGRAPRRAPPSVEKPGPSPGEPTAERKPPERDEHGNVKRTL